MKGSRRGKSTKVRAWRDLEQKLSPDARARIAARVDAELLRGTLSEDEARELEARVRRLRDDWR